MPVIPYLVVFFSCSRFFCSNKKTKNLSNRFRSKDENIIYEKAYKRILSKLSTDEITMFLTPKTFDFNIYRSVVWPGELNINLRYSIFFSQSVLLITRVMFNIYMYSSTTTFTWISINKSPQPTSFTIDPNFEIWCYE